MVVAETLFRLDQHNRLVVGTTRAERCRDTLTLGHPTFLWDRGAGALAAVLPTCG